jgi:uncharacterized membrane protein YphA (DoxX/SURF4 family)
VLIAALIAAIVLGALLLSAYGKLTKNVDQVKTITGVGFPDQYIWALALCELAGALGVFVGLFWWPVGVAAAIGVILYFILAVAAHLRKRDYAIQASAVMLTLGVIYPVLRLLAL